LAGQYPAVDEQLTGRENLDIVGRLYHMKGSEARARAAELLAQFSLSEAADRTVKTYSGGMRRRLDLAASIVARPRVLFLDEPTTGLDTRGRTELWAVIRDLVRDGTTLLLTTQYLEEADVLADYIAVIDLGLVIAQGTADKLKSQFGNDVLEVTLADGGQLAGAADALTVIAADTPQTRADSASISVSVSNGTQSLVEAVRVLDARHIAIADLGLRRPSLDDVFLALTGRPTESDESNESNGKRRHFRRKRQ
jgi:ABC-2 type transport system ATP-binding protein